MVRQRQSDDILTQRELRRREAAERMAARFGGVAGEGSVRVFSAWWLLVPLVTLGVIGVAAVFLGDAMGQVLASDTLTLFTGRDRLSIFGIFCMVVMVLTFLFMRARNMGLRLMGALTIGFVLGIPLGIGFTAMAEKYNGIWVNTDAPADTLRISVVHLSEWEEQSTQRHRVVFTTPDGKRYSFYQSGTLSPLWQKMQQNTEQDAIVRRGIFGFPAIVDIEQHQ